MKIKSIKSPTAHFAGELETQINFVFQDKKLLTLAMTHSSATSKGMQNNQKLEFLGDSVLNFIVADHLLRTHPNDNEGSLTKTRSALVNAKVLAIIAREIGLEEFLILGKSVRKNGQQIAANILADGLEALFGAVYLDAGIEPLKKIVLKCFKKHIDNQKHDHSENFGDFKSELQELVQDQSKTAPIYKVLSEQGLSHQKSFTMGVYIENAEWGQGTGENKKIASQNAARNALVQWKSKAVSKAKQSKAKAEC